MSRLKTEPKANILVVDKEKFGFSRDTEIAQSLAK